MSVTRSSRLKQKVISSPISPLVVISAYIVDVWPAYCALKMRKPRPGRPTISSLPTEVRSARTAAMRSPVAMYGVAPGSEVDRFHLAAEDVGTQCVSGGKGGPG